MQLQRHRLNKKGLTGSVAGVVTLPFFTQISIKTDGGYYEESEKS